MNSPQLMVDSDGSDESDAAKKQQRVRAPGKRKIHEDLDPKDNLSQLACTRPSNMPSHLSLGAPVTHRTAKDLTPTFLRDAKLEVSKPGFIRWFIATCPRECSACARKVVACGHPPVADVTQRNFKCRACRNERGGICSWLQDLLEVYIREAYQLDVGEARVLASSKSNDPQGTLSSYYQTWLAEPTGRCSDDESRERLKTRVTSISWDRSRKRKMDSRVSSAQYDLLHQAPAQRPSPQLPLPESQPKPQKRVKLIVHPPRETATSGSGVLTTTIPGQGSLDTCTCQNFRLFAGHPPPLSASPPISSGLRQPLSLAVTPTLVPANFSPPTTALAAITTLEIHSNAPQYHSPAQADDRHATSQHHPGDNLPNTAPNNFNAGTNEAFAGADPRPPSCNIVRLKSDMATLSDGLAKLAVEDLSLQADFSNRQEAESYLLKMLRGSLQVCDFLRKIVDQQDSRHVAVTRSLEDRICSLALENGQLKKGVAAQCLEQKICLLEVENDQLRGRLVRQDQELEDGRLQGRTVKGLEPKIRQLEAETDQLREKIDHQEQVIATMSARTQLADCVLRLTSQQDLPAPADTQADTNLRGLVSMIHARLDGIQPTPARQRLRGLGKGDGESDSKGIGQS
ncbi:hypothetical protein DFJ58DRAFT_914641 [Suillus subalutaceus]|uniref:uncharacterized protein n=1 Tax=Suillus subalutaceus TaxID=48586 RepID=UPI001B87F790|nr:uncharacterized protein DFJ58DRAFT_914641 [Suillus subalutaceus]KAG1850849.1 hypothetical protein DFJ58DRAFT_914641 [Suillus subalutaceus]